MASSSYSPSSSALTIQIPSKSILKRPSAQPPSLFSRITMFLPSPNHVAHIDESKPLKIAHFILPQFVTVYPISSLNPPSTPNLREEKKAIEDRQTDQREESVSSLAEPAGTKMGLSRVTTRAVGGVLTGSSRSIANVPLAVRRSQILPYCSPSRFVSFGRL